jgi:hypothetical protein
MRTPRTNHWEVNGSTEQKMVSLLSSLRVPQKIAYLDPSVPDPLTVCRCWREEIGIVGE